MSTDAGTPTPSREEIIEWLRWYEEFHQPNSGTSSDPKRAAQFGAAANEIERLERELSALHEAAQAEIAALMELEKELLQVILALPQAQFEKFRYILSKHRDITLPIEKELEAARKAK